MVISMDAKIVNLTSLFSGDIAYQIPQFQRIYAWDREEQWMPLWEDVKSIAEELMKSGGSSGKPHFMGAIVLQPRAKKAGEVAKILVVDGQQRLTTLQLLIRAAQLAFEEVSDNERAERLRSLTENDESQLQGDPGNLTKIRQSNYLDQTAFHNAIIMPHFDIGSSSQLIASAFRFFKGEVDTWLNDGTAGREEKSCALVATLAKYLQVAAIDLDHDEKPHIIFETLNARGEPLKQSDLIKNTVMYEANVTDDATTARRLWALFDDEWWQQSTGEPRVERIQLDRFLNHWMAMQSRQEVSHLRVAAEFRKYVASQQTPDIYTITEGVKVTGAIYKDFLEVRDDDEEVRIFLKRMKILDIVAAMPLLLWLKTSKVPREQVKQCFQIIESFLVRRMLCRLISHGLGGYFINLLNKLHDQPPRNCLPITIEHFGSSTSTSTIWPNNRMLIEQLTTRPLPGTVARQKMVVEAIEDYIRGELTESLLDTSKLTVEHIMPKKWGTHWRLPTRSPTQEEIEERDEKVRFLGNLTLTTSKMNSSLSNGPWRRKRRELKKHATFLLTQNLVSEHFENYDEKSILKRTHEMAEVITKVWRPWDHYRSLTSR